jgi:DNA-binding transcriptional MocR family regulator
LSGNLLDCPGIDPDVRLPVEPDVRERRLTLLRRQLDHATQVLRERLPELGFRPPDGGLNLWLRLPAGTSTAFAEVAGRQGVAVVPGALLSHNGAAEDHVRVTYAHPPEVFDEGVARLASAWEIYSRMTPVGDLLRERPVVL